MIDLKLLDAAYESARQDVLETADYEDDVDFLVLERLKEIVGGELAKFVDRKHWQRADAVNKAHFDNN